MNNYYFRIYFGGNRQLESEIQADKIEFVLIESIRTCEILLQKIDFEGNISIDIYNNVSNEKLIYTFSV